VLFESGLLAGDVVTAFQGTPVQTRAEIASVVNGLTTPVEVTLSIQRALPAWDFL
jgi:S1-C subfamily serine protease